MRTTLLVVLSVVLSVGIGVGTWIATNGDSDRTADGDDRGLPDGVTLQSFTAAEREFQANYGREPDRIDTLSWLAERLVGEGDAATAVACFREIPDDDPRYGHAARLQEGQLLLKLHKAREAERSLRTYLRLERDEPRSPPEDVIHALRLLVDLCGVQQRLEDQRPLLGLLAAVDAQSPHETMIFLFPTQHRWVGGDARKRLEGFLETTPDDTNLLLARVHYLTFAGEFEAAARDLESCGDRLEPDDLDRISAELVLLDESGRLEELEAAVASLPAYTEREPWIVTLHRGRAAARDGRHDEAVVEFERLLEKLPTHGPATSEIAASLAVLGRDEDAAFARRRTSVLGRVSNRLTRVSQYGEAAALVDMAGLCLEGDFLEEAAALIRLGERLGVGDGELGSVRERLAEKDAR